MAEPPGGTRGTRSGRDPSPDPLLPAVFGETVTFPYTPASRFHYQAKQMIGSTWMEEAPRMSASKLVLVSSADGLEYVHFGLKVLTHAEEKPTTPCVVQH